MFKIMISAFAIVVGASTMSLAQSLPNYGPNAPAHGDSFGKPYSGAQPLRSKARGHRAYAKRIYVHKRYKPYRQPRQVY